MREQTAEVSAPIEQEFLSVIREYERVIYKVCYLYANPNAPLNDLYQDVVLNLWKAYPKYRNKEYQLRKKQTPHSYKYECVKQIACRLGLLIALEQEIQSNEKSDRYQISCIQYVHGRADGNQQEINGCLY